MVGAAGEATIDRAVGAGAANAFGAAGGARIGGLFEVVLREDYPKRDTRNDSDRQKKVVERQCNTITLHCF